MTRPLLVDLCSGAGGAAMGYWNAGWNVLCVDKAPQPRLPRQFTFVQADIFEWLSWVDLERLGVRAVHASPPCQAFSQRTLDHSVHPDLITPLRPLLLETGLPYVIENVPGAPLRGSIQLCGSSFWLRVRRHRWFESNVPIRGKYCNHKWQNSQKDFTILDHGKEQATGVIPVYGNGGRKAREEWNRAMGISWMSANEMREAIPPAFTEYIGRQLMECI